MKNTILKVSLILSLFLVSLTSYAQERPPHPPKEYGKHQGGMHGKGGHSPMDKLTKLLPDLTEDQKSKIKDIFLTTMKEGLPIHNQIAEKEARLQTLSTAEKVDEKAINKTIDEISDLKATMMKKRMSSVQKVRALLTDDQRIIFDTHHKSMMKGGHHGKGHGKGHHPRGR